MHMHTCIMHAYQGDLTLLILQFLHPLFPCLFKQFIVDLLLGKILMCQVVSGEISEQTNSKPIAFIHHSLDWYRCLPQGKLSQTNQLSQTTATRMGATISIVRDKLKSLPEILSHITCIPVNIFCPIITCR